MCHTRARCGSHGRTRPRTQARRTRGPTVPGELRQARGDGQLGGVALPCAAAAGTRVPQSPVWKPWSQELWEGPGERKSGHWGMTQRECGDLTLLFLSFLPGYREVTAPSARMCCLVTAPKEKPTMK